MAKVLLLHLNDVSDAMIVTSLIKRLVRDNNVVHCITNDSNELLFEYSGATNVTADDAKKETYDTAINLSPSYLCANIFNKISANKKLGYGLSDEEIEFFNEGAKRHYETIHLGKETKSNLFQLTFSVANLVWQGEGYGISYFPRNKTRKGLTGLATKDSRLRNFLINNLKLEYSKIWQIPFKKNVLKQIDETNRCKQIVTDENVIFHISLALRKNVELIISREPPYKVELFGSGNLHIYDPLTIGTQETNVT
jgi:hypothetical protein